MAERSRFGDTASLQGLAATIQGRLGRELPLYSQRRCIYKVPYPMRQAMENTCTPEIVSIGPLYHKNEMFLPMEPHKLTYLQSFLRDSQPNGNLNTYLKIIKDKETEIRECYADPIHLSSDDFTHMILIDSIFIIELFKRCYSSSLPNEDDYICGRPWMRETIISDILLEENQLPFFILTILYRAAFKQTFPAAIPSFTEMACKILDIALAKINVDDYTNETMYCHLLDLLWHHYKPADTPTNSIIESGYWGIDEDPFDSPTATQLYETGVKLLLNTDAFESADMVQIQFNKDKRVLSIPKITVDAETERRFRNLMAFEQCHYSRRNLSYFTSFLWFLDMLIDTPEDVRLLVKKKIIANLGGEEKAVSDLINSVCGQSILGREQFRYSAMTLQLMRHYRRSWNRHRATLKHTYFKHPWATISVVYATIILILTIIQVVGAILEMKKKDHKS